MEVTGVEVGSDLFHIPMVVDEDVLPTTMWEEAELGRPVEEGVVLACVFSEIHVVVVLS